MTMYNNEWDMIVPDPFLLSGLSPMSYQIGLV